MVATFATEEPREQWKTYERVFKDLGAGEVVHLDARTRGDVISNPQLDLLEGAGLVFFGGGDQLKVTTKLGGTV